MQRPSTSTRRPSHDPTTSSISSKFPLKFPTIPVNGTPASWDSHSLLIAMAPTHDESGDDTTSSLGDSSYDFIDDRSNATTDDEDQDALTESTTSSDGHTFEQIPTPFRDAERGGLVDQSLHYQASDYPQSSPVFSRPEPVMSGEGFDQAATNPNVQQMHEPIEFDEPSITNLNASRFTEVFHTLKTVEKQPSLDDFYYQLLDRLQGHLAVTVRQTMISHSLTPKDGQYKIMYVGDAAAREQILQKIGTALAANLKCSMPDSETPRSSKFNIVPISAFGEESWPEVVLIDSSGLELIVEDCHNASFDRKEGSNDSLRLDLSGGTTVHSHWNGSDFEVSDSWRLPDLAIFCLPDDDNFTLKMTRQFARSFMSRHKVLSIVISQSPTWEKSSTEPITLDYLSPHITLESRNSSLIHAQIIRRYPVDLATFMSIDAGQMNRNLACLAAASRSPKSQLDPQPFAKQGKRSPVKSHLAIREIINSLVNDVQKDGLKGLNRYEYLAGFAVILISLLSMLVVGLGLSELLGASRVSNSRVFPANISVPSVPSVSTSSVLHTAHHSSSSTLAPTIDSLSPISTHAPPEKGSPANTDLASFLLDTYALSPDKSEQFKIHVLGDCHVILRLPHWFSKVRKNPRLSFKILHGNTEIEHQATILFDGVYALQIRREDAYGVLRVKTWTDTKPIINESFEVDFGSSWLKVAGWKKATRIMSEALARDVHSAQSSLSSVLDHVNTSISTFLGQQREKIAGTMMIKSHLGTAARTREFIVAQVKDKRRTWLKRLHTTRAIAKSRISQNLEEFSKEVARYTRTKSSTFSNSARLLIRTVGRGNVKAKLSGIADLRKRSVRGTQKKMLKAWWCLKGAPEQKRTKGKVKRHSPQAFGF